MARARHVARVKRVIAGRAVYLFISLQQKDF